MKYKSNRSKLGGLWLSLAETWVCLVRDALESFKSKHETAREVGTFKAARDAAQDRRKSTFSGQKSGENPTRRINLTHLPSTPKYARARASGPSP